MNNTAGKNGVRQTERAEGMRKCRQTGREAGESRAMWRDGLGAAGEKGGHEGEGEHAAELDTFQSRKPSFPQRKSVVM